MTEIFTKTDKQPDWTTFNVRLWCKSKVQDEWEPIIYNLGGVKYQVKIRDVEIELVRVNEERAETISGGTEPTSKFLAHGQKCDRCPILMSTGQKYRYSSLPVLAGQKYCSYECLCVTEQQSGDESVGVPL